MEAAHAREIRLKSFPVRHNPGDTMPCQQRFRAGGRCTLDARARGSKVSPGTYESQGGELRLWHREYECGMKHRFSASWTEPK